MRPATAPSGSRITASVTDSHTSSRPRMIGTSRSPRAPSSADSRLRCSTSTGARPSADGAGTPVIRSAAAVPEDDLAVAVDRDDAVGDVGEDRHRALALERDALVELGVRERGRRARGDGEQRLDLLLAPLARLDGVDGEDADGRSLRPTDGHAEEGRMARPEHRVESAQALVLACLRERHRRAGLDDVAREPAAGRAARAESVRRSVALGGSDHELVAVEQVERGGVGVDERGRLLHDLVEHGRRVELAREQPAGARQLLRERARPALGLEQLAPLERAARRIGEVAGELEVVVAERPLLGEEDEHEPAAGLPRRLDRDGEERAIAVPSRRGAQVRRADARRPRWSEDDEDAALGAPRGRAGRGVPPPARRACGRASSGQLVRPRPASSRPLDADEHGRGASAQRLRGGLCDRLERRRPRQRLPERRTAIR